MGDAMHLARLAALEGAMLALLNEYNAGNPHTIDELSVTMKADRGVCFGDIQYISGGVPLSGEGF